MRIMENAKLDEDSAFEELMKTVIGEIQKEFLLSLDKEIERASSFYVFLTKNIIR